MDKINDASYPNVSGGNVKLLVAHNFKLALVPCATSEWLKVLHSFFNSTMYITLYPHAVLDCLFLINWQTKQLCYLYFPFQFPFFLFFISSLQRQLHVVLDHLFLKFNVGMNCTRCEIVEELVTFQMILNDLLRIMFILVLV